MAMDNGRKCEGQEQRAKSLILKWGLTFLNKYGQNTRDIKTKSWRPPTRQGKVSFNHDCSGTESTELPKSARDLQGLQALRPLSRRRGGTADTSHTAVSLSLTRSGEKLGRWAARPNLPNRYL